MSNGSIIITPVNPRRVDQEELERHLNRIGASVERSSGNWPTREPGTSVPFSRECPVDSCTDDKGVWRDVWCRGSGPPGERGCDARCRFRGEFLHKSLPAMAAAYLFHVCKNHPFFDGNKRVAVARRYSSTSMECNSTSTTRS